MNLKIFLGKIFLRAAFAAAQELESVIFKKDGRQVV
jgi:hypothetical protein